MTAHTIGRGSGIAVAIRAAMRWTVFAFPLVAAGESWALSIQQCTSADGHVYVIVTTLTASIGTQVTSIAMTDGSTTACVKQAGVAGPVVSAFAGASGRPLANRMRTTVLSGFSTNAVSCDSNFDPEAAEGRGALTLPGPMARTVSADPAFSSETLVPMGQADDLVPAAIDMHHMVRPRLRCRGDTMVFPAGGDGERVSNGEFGEAAEQAVTFDDTRGTRVGNQDVQPFPDGFLLQGNCGTLSTCQIIVFVGEIGPDCSKGASVSAAGFAVDGSLMTGSAEAAMQTGSNRVCSP